MSDIYVRTRTYGGLNDKQRRALALLAEYNEATVGARTGIREGALSIHRETAMVLFRGDYIRRTPGGIEITEKGVHKVEQRSENPAARKRRKAAEALQAQETGEWVPAPAGASAQADSDQWWAARELAEAHANV